MSNNDRRSHENLTLDAFPRFLFLFIRFSGLGSSAVKSEYEYEYECSCCLQLLSLLLSCFMLISVDCSFLLYLINNANFKNCFQLVIIIIFIFALQQFVVVVFVFVVVVFFVVSCSMLITKVIICIKSWVWQAFRSVQHTSHGSLGTSRYICILNLGAYREFGLLC